MKNIYTLPALFIILAACQNTTKDGKPLDTIDSGEITVACDESLYPVIDAEHKVFESQFPRAKLNLIYTSEVEAINLMLSDSARIAIVTRSLYDNELAILNQQKISKARYTTIALDAIAFILNNRNTDTSFTLEQIKGFLSGEISNWNQVNSKSKLGNIRVVFDNPASGAIRLLKDSVLKGVQLGNNNYALQSNPAVIEYVKNNPNAIGIIGISWISDHEDKHVKEFLNTIKVAEIKPLEIKVNSISNKPMQGNIALKQYPLWREVKVISREARVGLGTGFASFMAGDSGQRIILKAGMVPKHAPVRIIELKQ